MARPTVILLAMLCAALLPAGRCGAADDGPQIAADFERGMPEGAGVRGAEAAVVVDGESDHVLRLKPARGGNGARVSVSLPVGRLKTVKSSRLRFSARAMTGGKALPLRWAAIDAAGRPIHQVRLSLPASDAWAELDAPVGAWRWGNTAVGAWADVRRLVLLVEGPADEVWLDDVRFESSPAGDPAPVDWLKRRAFGDGAARTVAEEGVLVATDARAEVIADTDLRRYASNMHKARALVARLFGDAVRPIDDATPPALLVFKDAAGYVGFWERMGTAWGATIGAPKAGGYTVYDISTSSYDPKVGPDRPVYLHESVHAIVAHDLRLLPGTPAHSWLQEGIANYVQLCVYPKSLEAGSFARAFAAPIRAEGHGLFRPLPDLLGGRPTVRNYAQLASLIAYLVEEKPAWLPKIARAVADGATADAAFGQCGTDLRAVQAAWQAWGQKRFAPDAAAGDDTHFATPAEWK